MDIFEQEKQAAEPSVEILLAVHQVVPQLDLVVELFVELRQERFGGVARGAGDPLLHRIAVGIGDGQDQRDVGPVGILYGSKISRHCAPTTLHIKPLAASLPVSGKYEPLLVISLSRSLALKL